MSMINGNLGGSLPSSIDFGQIENYDTIYEEVTFSDKTEYVANKYYVLNPNYTVLNGEEQYLISNDEYKENRHYYTKLMTSSIEALPLKQIIREAVHTYANELYENIVINDLEDYGLELLEYRGDTPLFFFFYKGICENMTYNKDMYCMNDNWSEPKKLSDLSLSNKEIDSLVEGFRDDTLEVYLVNVNIDEETGKITIIEDDKEKKLYTVARVEYGETAGYRQIDLIYPGELISNIGETLTSILDKIVDMLGDFEYFYDIDGRFIFQKKRTYINSTWNSLIATDDKDTYAENAAYTSDIQYSFEDNNLITSFSNNPQLNNLKNDFSVWGNRKGINNTDIPVHARFAIDKKPQFYRSFDGKYYYTDEKFLEEIKDRLKRTTITEVKKRLDNFQLQYEVPKYLKKPIKNIDGSWTAGWWDIRDWHDYYYALRLEEPDKTMKWYSRGNLEGCEKVSEIPWPDNVRLSFTEKDSYCWLIIVQEYKILGKDFYINLQHGSGNPFHGGRDCIQYYSYLDIDEKLYTKKVEPEVTKFFHYPYAGCSDTHTYLSFLKDDIESDGNLVYFYNPDFPETASFEEIVNDQIEKEFEFYIKEGYANLVDYREIIYQMALDYFKYNQDDDFLIKVRDNNFIANDYLYPLGKTGYEQYYTDIQGFWRDLYNPHPEVKRENIGGIYEDKKVLLNEEEETYKIEKQWVEFKEDESDFTCDFYLPSSFINNDYYKCSAENIKNHFSDKYAYWNKNVVEAPELLNFWLEILDDAGDLSKYSIPNIGDRAKSINDSKVTAIYFRETPNIIFTSYKDYDFLNLNTGYVYIWLQDYIANSFTISAQGKSAKDRIDELLYNHTYASENISLTTIPIYYLEPNTRIYVHDEESNINGDYIIDKITVPLTYNGTMSITANKAVERLY